MFRVAVFLTGALRTIRRTVRYLKQNILDVNPHAKVFACIQNDSSTPSGEWEEWIKESLGHEVLRRVIWYTPESFRMYSEMRDVHLQFAHIDPSWKQYLRTSGSIVEYVQMQQAYMAASYYETEVGEKFDYVIRVRTDSVFLKPVDFHWLHWSDEQVAERVGTIRHVMKTAGLDTEDEQLVQTYFMKTLLSDDTIPNIPNLCSNKAQSVLPVHFSTDASRLNEYLRHGRYILTFRVNHLYICKRDLFTIIPSLGSMYGFYKTPYSDPYWFNAENQFQGACYYSALTAFDYSTFFESTSLAYPHEWDEGKFFDEDFNPRHAHMVFCAVRR